MQSILIVSSYFRMINFRILKIPQFQRKIYNGKQIPLLMEEILHQLTGSLSHLQGFHWVLYIPGGAGFSSITQSQSFVGRFPLTGGAFLDRNHVLELSHDSLSSY